MRRFILPFVAAVLAAGCVALSQEAGLGGSGRRIVSATTFPRLDPGAKELNSLHFEVHSYSSERAAQVSRLSEDLYRRIMNDTGLYSFIPKGLYPIVVYGTRAEFQQKTGLPKWSAGAALGNAIVTYDGSHLSGVLAHEMTHLIFYEYMGGSDSRLRWLNEGLAVYEEQQAAPLSAPPGFAGPPIPFENMFVMAPLSEEQRKVDVWYQQVGSVVRFMLERGGQVGFSQFLRALRDRRPLRDAIRLGFPAAWSDATALENAWRRGK